MAPKNIPAKGIQISIDREGKNFNINRTTKRAKKNFSLKIENTEISRDRYPSSFFFFFLTTNTHVRKGDIPSRYIFRSGML